MTALSFTIAIGLDPKRWHFALRPHLYGLALGITIYHAKLWLSLASFPLD